MFTAYKNVKQHYQNNTVTKITINHYPLTIVVPRNFIKCQHKNNTITRPKEMPKLFISRIVRQFLYINIHNTNYTYEKHKIKHTTTMYIPFIYNILA